MQAHTSSAIAPKQGTAPRMHDEHRFARLRGRTKQVQPSSYSCGATIWPVFCPLFHAGLQACRSLTRRTAVAQFYNQSPYPMSTARPQHALKSMKSHDPRANGGVVIAHARHACDETRRRGWACSGAEQGNFLSILSDHADVHLCPAYVRTGR